MNRSKKVSIYENLDTAFVNLGALLRYLNQHNFNGLVLVEMDQYEADVELRAGEKPDVTERDHAMGREAKGEAALQRLLVRAMDSGGRISVYQYEGEASLVEHKDEKQSVSVEPEVDDPFESAEAYAHPAEEMDWTALLRAGAELIASVERASLAVGANFQTAFRAARLELADDYSFLDPNDGRFEYANNDIELLAGPSPKTFVSGLCETLHRVVEKIAMGNRGRGVRERVALELAVLARRRERQLAEFGILPQLDRIAGTRVI